MSSLRRSDSSYQGSKIGKDRIFLESIESTNTYALYLAEKGCPHGTVVLADSQTGGRGRHGRVWYSPPGKNIYMSIILRPQKAQKESGHLSLLTIMTAVAVSEAIEEKTAIPVMVKWPNDLMVSVTAFSKSHRLAESSGRGFKKVGGILSEARFSGKRCESAVVGVGINVNLSEKDFPPDIIESATSLRIAAGRDIDRGELLEGILRYFDNWYGVLIRGQKERIINRWKEFSLTIGKDVKVITGDRVIKGLAMDIDEDGRLLLQLPSGEIKRIDSGDIIHLR